MQIRKIYLQYLFILITLPALAQENFKAWNSGDIFKTNYFIENKGQFDLLQNHVKNVQFAYDNNGHKIVFTKTGFSYQIIEKVKRTKKEIEELEQRENPTGKKENPKEVEAEMKKFEYKLIQEFVDMEWLNTNPNVQLEYINKTNHYFSYGEEKYKSYGYDKVIYKNLYNHIDVAYKIHPKGGIEYILYLHPGANLADVQFKYSGNTAKIKVKDNAITVKNKVGKLEEKDLHAFYSNKENINIKYVESNGIISFSSDSKINNSREVVVDPWVTSITTFSSSNTVVSNIGYDVDFDNAGNLYAYGGDYNSLDPCKIAKYSSNGVLLWTFGGIVSTANWNGCPYPYTSNFVVDKLSGKCYTGQGFNFLTGAIVVRLNTAGIYDNFISIANSNYQEVWELKINCATGAVIAMGGSTQSDLNIAIIDTITGVTTTSNITGFLGTNFQDIVNAVIDGNGEVYTIFASATTSNVNNKIFKQNANYSTTFWSQFTGYSTLNETSNKDFLGTSSSNGANILAVNSSYLFYYDGVNLKAFNKLTGATVGTPLTLNFALPLYSTGIVANNCNEVFLGGDNGNILKYSFNGTIFTPLPAIVIPGKAGLRIHDMQLNPINNLLYVIADSFVATVDPNSSCLSAITSGIILSSDSICPNTGVVSITNAVNTLSYTFIWQDTNTGLIVKNQTKLAGVTSDTLAGLIVGHVYKVTVLEPSNCNVLSNYIFLSGGCGFLEVYLCTGATYTLSNGTVLNTVGTYTDTLTNITGLDSIVTVVLFTGIDTIITTKYICNGATYTLPNGTVTSLAGTYTFSFTNVNGCDSTIITNLFFNQIFQSTKNVSICPSNNYTLPDGTIVNTAGIYKDTFINVDGCDSIITTNLTLKPNTSSTFTTNICANKFYTLPNGTNVNSAGTYTLTYMGSNGCDSFRYITLQILPVYNVSVNATICQGDTYLMPNGLTQNTPGLYKNIFSNIYNCDSVIDVNLIIKPWPVKIIFDTICENQFYILPNTSTVNIAGVYKDTLQRVNDCDSVVIINLFVVPIPVVNLSNDTLICIGDTIMLNGAATNNATNNIKYLWNNGQTTSTVFTGVLGKYIIAAQDYPCPIVTDSIIIDGKYCLCTMYVPNAFTPNGDGYNDVFKPTFICSKEIVEYKMNIYNRWGNKVFESTSFEKGWNGENKLYGGDMNNYFYLIEYTNPISKQREVAKGDVMLVR